MAGKQPDGKNGTTGQEEGKKAQDDAGPESIQALVDEEPLYDQTPLPALKRRRIWKRLRWLLLLLLLAPFIYFIVQLFIILAPRMRTDVVMLDTMTDAVEVRGVVVMDSTPVTGQGGYLHYAVPAGQRVTAETVVASVFDNEQAVVAMERLAEVNTELELLQDAQNTVADGGDLDALLGQMQSGLYGMIGGIENGEYGNLAGPRGEVQLAANKIRISTGEEANFEARIIALNNQKQQYEQLAVPVGTITAPQTGYFAPSQLHDRVQLNHEEADGLSPVQMQRAIEAEPTYYGTDVVGHIVSSYKWTFFTVVDLAQAVKFNEGDTGLQLAFPDAGDLTVPVTVEKVTEDADEGIALVELFSEYMSPELLNMRVETAEIVFGVKKGIRIEKNALRLADIENEDGTMSTFQGVYVKFGNMVYFRKIQILVEDENYMLVPDEVIEGVNEVRLYDDVVMDSGGVELYDRKIL